MIAWLAAERVDDFLLGREAVFGEARELLQLDLVDFVIAAHERKHQSLLADHDD